MGAKDNERLKKNLSIHLVIAIAPDIIIYIIVLKRLMKWLSRRLLRHASRWWGCSIWVGANVLESSSTFLVRRCCGSQGPDDNNNIPGF
jgi:hypothetical protein